MKTPQFILALALVAAPLCAFAGVTIGVDKAELITDLAAGEKRVLKLKVTNSGTEATPVTVYAEDWQITNGEPDFNNQVHPRALGRRVTLAPASFALAAGAAQEVTVVVDAGNEAIRVVAADDAGFYGLHVAEHHCSPLNTIPVPGVWLAAVAGRAG